jgi:hypothetical protein
LRENGNNGRDGEGRRGTLGRGEMATSGEEQIPYERISERDRQRLLFNGFKEHPQQQLFPNGGGFDGHSAMNGGGGGIWKQEKEEGQMAVAAATGTSLNGTTPTGSVCVATSRYSPFIQLLI